MTTTHLELPLAARALPRLMADTRYVLSGFPLAVSAGAIAVIGVAAPPCSKPVSPGPC